MGRPAADVAGALGVLPAGVFDRLGHGLGDAGATGLLADAQLAVNRALVGEVAGETAAGGTLLAALERRAPAVLDDVLGHPFVRAWAVTCLDGSARPEPERAAAIAAAVAVRAGIAVEVPVLARQGWIHLPTVGAFRAPAGEVLIASGPGSFTLRWPGGRAVVPADGTAAAPGWRAARWVTAGGVRVLLEDADPYRNRLSHAAPGRLDDAAADGWARALAAAWAHLAVDAPDQEPGLRRVLRVIVPLTAAADGSPRGATSRHAFGAVGLAPPTDPATLAALLVREFQHTKIDAVLDLVDLVTTGPDPRRVEATLRGAYADLAVAALWRRRAGRGVAGGHDLFRMYRERAAAAITGLLAGDRLTGAGTRFAGRMAATVRGWGSGT